MVQQQNQEEHLFGGLATAGTALGGQGAVAAIKLHNLKMLQRQQRKKKKVDTKASKGRKIRYQVQEKLVGFMAPEPKGEWTTERMDEFFASLLIETGTEADTVDASAPAPAQVMEDGFKLF
ncbi:TRAUB-domain-containing protein [Caulochytrium protostelioides]|nr:TRAUB-domain-containing protein [Caulochytrium protostelioides]